MQLSEILTYTSLLFSVIFFLSGLGIMLFGNKQNNSQGKAEMNLKAGDLFNISMPYQMWIVLCLFGLALMYMSHSFYANGGEDQALAQQKPSFSLFGQAYAATIEEQISAEQWTYFGYQKNKSLWHFDFITGDLTLMLKNQPVQLKSKNALHIRPQPFGSLTGTVLNFLSPASKPIGTLAAAKCIETIQAKSVGFSKIWIQFKPIPCPST